MNWGYKIMFVYVAFAAGILAVVFWSAQQSNDLVTPDYYAKELKFQDQIDQSARSRNLSGKLKVRSTGDSLVIVFPGDFAGKTITGDLQLYFAADQKRDINQKLNLSELEYKMQLPAQNKGFHQVNIQATVEGVSYYFEEKIFL